MPPSAASALPASAQHTFRVHKPPPAMGRKGKLETKHRLKVKSVREMRACLRCSVLRIPCSQDDICIPCRKLVETARHAHEKRTLSFCACIRTRLVEVNLFEDSIPPPHALGSILEKTGKLALRSITLSFGSQITWDLPTLVLEIVDWLNYPQRSETSKVGTLSSPEFLDLLEPYVDPEIGVSFQRMLYAESLAYVQQTADKKHTLSIPELQEIGALAGHNILSFLDHKLRSDSLRACSKENLEATFLLLVGTILAVGYTCPNLHSDKLQNERNGDDTGCFSRFTAMQNHLCQILAHYVVFIGSKLNLPLANSTERFILQTASERWHKEGIFQWKTRAGFKTNRYAKVNGGSSFCSMPLRHSMTDSDQAYDQPILGCPNETAWNEAWLDQLNVSTESEHVEVDLQFLPSLGASMCIGTMKSNIFSTSPLDGTMLPSSVVGNRQLFSNTRSCMNKHEINRSTQRRRRRKISAVSWPRIHRDYEDIGECANIDWGELSPNPRRFCWTSPPLGLGFQPKFNFIDVPDCTGDAAGLPSSQLGSDPSKHWWERMNQTGPGQVSSVATDTDMVESFLIRGGETAPVNVGPYIFSKDLNQTSTQTFDISLTDYTTPRNLHAALGETAASIKNSNTGSSALEQGPSLTPPSDFEEFSELSMKDIPNIPQVFERYPQLCLEECRSWRDDQAILKEILAAEISKAGKNLLV